MRQYCHDTRNGEAGAGIHQCSFISLRNQVNGSTAGAMVTGINYTDIVRVVSNSRELFHKLTGFVYTVWLSCSRMAGFSRVEVS